MGPSVLFSKPLRAIFTFIARLRPRWFLLFLLFAICFGDLIWCGSAEAAVVEPEDPDPIVRPAVVYENDLFLPLLSTGAALARQVPPPELLSDDPAFQASFVELCVKNLNKGQNIQGNLPDKPVAGHWAGVFNVTLGGLAQRAFCTDINNPISTNKCYKNSAMGVTSPLVACTLQYYPPEDGLSNSEAAARQAAVWYFADGFVVAASDAVKPRADAIVADVRARHAAGECAELAVPRMTLTPPSATNYLVPKAGGGFQSGTHTFTVTVAVGTQPLPDQAVTVSTDRGQLNGIGSSVVVTTGIGGQATVTLTHNAVGVSLISASTQITLPRSLRIDPGPNIQKVVLSGEQPFELKAASQKEWLAGSVIVVKKFADFNQNGQQDPGEPLINWGVRYRSEPSGEWKVIELGNDGTATLAVDSNQTYTVCEIKQPDWVLTTEAECISGVEPPRTLLFGNAALRALLVEKFEDRDGNGLRNQGDIPLDGWGFTLYQFIDGVWSNKGSGVTANGGLLGFIGLQAGTYRVVENPLQGWVGSTPTTQEIALVGAETQARLSFGNLQPARLQFSKSWYDDGHSVPAPDTPATVCLQRQTVPPVSQPITPTVAGVPLSASGDAWCWPALTTTVTVDNIWPGSYTLSEIPPLHWTGVLTPTAVTLQSGDAGAKIEVSNLRQRPALSVIKQCPSDLFIGDTVFYTLVVMNSGNVPLQQVEVRDPLVGLTKTLDSLSVGQSVVMTASIKAASQGVMTNTAEAETEYLGETVTDSATCATQLWGLTISKSADLSYTQPYTWTVAKAVTPTEILLDAGHAVTATYVISAARTALPPIKIRVTGAVTVANPAPISAQLDGLEDRMAGQAVPLDCDGPLTIAANSMRLCTYDQSLASLETMTNVVTATQRTNTGDHTIRVATAPVDFTYVQPATVLGSVVLTDSNQGSEWPITGTTTIQYETLIDCTDATYAGLIGQTVLTNTVQIRETGQESTAALTRVCRRSAIVAEKEVDWGTVITDTEQTFDLCITGPSFPSGAEAGACQTVGYAGGILTWSPLHPGDYRLTEANLGPTWNIPDPVDVTAMGGMTSSVSVRNTNTGGQGDMTGAIAVNKVVNWNGRVKDPTVEFVVCVGPQNPAPSVEPVCTRYGPDGGQNYWTGLKPGTYVISEAGVDTNVWHVTGDGQVVTVVAERQSTVEITNTALRSPTSLPPVTEPKWTLPLFLPLIQR